MESAEPMVLQTLLQACSQEKNSIDGAEKQLKIWETHPGFYSVLSSIFLNYELDMNARWMAVLYFKNGVDQYWRKTAPNAIAENEKSVIKDRLISNFREPMPQIATQVAVLIGKIARQDCPNQWQSLVPVLLEAIRCDDILVQQRGLLVFYHVTKVLASRRLAAGRKMFENLTKEIIQYMDHLWHTHLTNFVQLANQQHENMAASIEQARLVLKILRKLAVYGFKEPQTNEHVSKFISALFPQMETLLDIRRSMWGNHDMLEKCEHLLTTMTKVLLEMLDNHPAFYVSFIKTTLQFVLTYNFTSKGMMFERFTVHCFNLMKDILFCHAYKHSQKDDVSAETLETYSEARKVMAEFFTFETVSELCRRLVSQYLLLTTDDLIAWEEDPEDFCQESGGDSYKYSLRPCTESLFLTIFTEYNQPLTPVLLQLVQANQGPCDPDDMQAVLKKDAVYNAIGQASFDLMKNIDYDSWFSNHLLKELQIKDQRYCIIRKRVVWLMGQWVNMKMGSELRPALYEAIISLLQRDEDMAVRLEAAQTLKTAVDDFEFAKNQLMPYIESLFSLLYNLLRDVRESASKMHVLDVLSFVIDRMGPDIRQYYSCLVQYLPLLWQDLAEHNLVRCAILTTLYQLVRCYEADSPQLYDFILPVIDFSTDTEQPQHVYLMEDGLELWFQTLLYAPTSSPALLNLFRNMPKLLEGSTENLYLCIKITEMYVLIGARDFMHEFSGVLANCLAGMIWELKDEGIQLIMNLVDTVLKAFPVEGPHVFMTLLPSIFLSMLKAKDEASSLTATQITLFSRILLQNQDAFWAIVQQTAQSLGQDSVSVFGQLLDVLCDRLDFVSHPERFKICGLALSSLLTQNNPVITERFGTIISGIVHTMNIINREGEEDGQFVDCMIHCEDDPTQVNKFETPHDVRKRQLWKQDPVYTVHLNQYVTSQITQCRSLHGQDAFNQLVGKVDLEVIKKFETFVH